MEKPIPFIDLAAQQARFRTRLDARLASIMDKGSYILGPEVGELEEKLSVFAGIAHTLACASGTDALALPLMAWGIGPGDAVFVPSFTFAATAEVVALVGATPVFVDVHAETFNIDAASLRRAVEEVLTAGELRPAAIIAVDLFGQIADYAPMREVADEFGLKLISDAAQGFGSTRGGAMAGKWADVVSTSFYPAKPLGCYGDGGAVQTDDAELAHVMRSLSVHGQGTERYDNVRIGLTSRLDTFQAAVLLEKFAIFPEEIEARHAIAARYTASLGPKVAVQALAPDVVSTWAQYTIRIPAGGREAFMASMRAAGVPTVIYYARPLHRQTAYDRYPVEGGRLAVTDMLCAEVVSLPMHAYLDTATQDRVLAAAHAALGEAASQAA